MVKFDPNGKIRFEHYQLWTRVKEAPAPFVGPGPPANQSI